MIPKIGYIGLGLMGGDRTWGPGQLGLHGFAELAATPGLQAGEQRRGNHRRCRLD